jgi:hypothetical protein
VACPENTFNPDTTAPSVASCRACDPNAAAPSASFAVEACACNLGYAGAPGEACTACEPGTYCDESSPGHICEQCPTNTYNAFYSTVAPSACLSCHANTSSTAGSRSQRACVCDPGLFGVLHPEESGYYACTPCAAGSFSLHANSSACTACPVGSVSMLVCAQTEAVCQTCTGGSVALEPGLTVCGEIHLSPSFWYTTAHGTFFLLFSLKW